MTDVDHINETGCFLAPMDQLHTLTGSLRYNHTTSGLWIGTTVEYGSGTPSGEAEGREPPLRAEGHLIASVSFGADLRRDARHRSRLSLTFDV